MKRLYLSSDNFQIELMDFSKNKHPIVQGTLTPSSALPQSGTSQTTLQVFRISALAIMCVFLPVPLIDYTNMVVLYHNWAYWLSIITFGMLIYPSFDTAVDYTYDLVTRMLFQVAMVVQMTSVAYYFTSQYIAETKLQV